jgi:hypothetical protein
MKEFFFLVVGFAAGAAFMKGRENARNMKEENERLKGKLDSNKE